MRHIVLRSMRLVFLLMLMMLLVFSQKCLCASEEEPVSLLILSFDNTTEHSRNDALEKGIPDLLTAYLSPYSDEILIIDRSIIDHIVREFSLQDFTSPESQARLGELTQAKFILRGSFLDNNSALELTGILYDTESAQVVKTFSVENTLKLNAAVQSLAVQLAGFLETEINELPNLPVEEDPQKSLAMIYGLGYYHNRQYPQAITQFMKILEEKTNDEDARYWLGKSFWAADLDDHAEIAFEQFMNDFPSSSRLSEVQGVLDQLSQEIRTEDEK